MSTKYRIEYEDPATLDMMEYIGEFDSLDDANDYGYMLADKGWYECSLYLGGE